MKKFIRRFTAFLLVCVMTLSFCLTALPQAQAADTKTVKLYPAQASPFNNGEFQGWGTSLCWWANRVGYSDKLTQLAADAFFSENGLSLDIARYNIGGGDNPDHKHIIRSDSKVPGLWETFVYSADGKDVTIAQYDIMNDQNQLNVAKAALAANPNLYFEGFSNSAPYFMTNNGCTSGADYGKDDNLRGDMYDDFAKYIADCTRLLAAEGIKFQSYSPINEPTAEWGKSNPYSSYNKQEGCHFNAGASESKIIVETRRALDAAGLSDVLVASMDESNINDSVANLEQLTPEAKAALGRIDTHTYGGNQRATLKAKAQAFGKDLWMSEVDGDFKSGNTAMKGALGLAERIILDMNEMQPAAWVMWNIIDTHQDRNFYVPVGTTPLWWSDTENKYVEDPVKENWYTENGNLNAWDPDNGMWGVALADHDEGKLYLSQKYYGYGQFTRYINPGDTIIATDDSTHILAAYNRVSGDIKIVAVNESTSELPYTFDLSAFLTVGTEVQTIRTSGSYAEGEHWKEINDDNTTLSGKTLTTTLKGSSITTFVIRGRTVQLPEGTYTLQTGDGRYLNFGAVDSNDPNKSALNLTTTSQSLTLVSDGAGRYTVQRDGKCLDAFLNDRVYTGNVGGYTVSASGAANQKWQIVQNDDGTYALIGGNGGALDWKDCTENSTTLKLCTPDGNETQKWTLSPQKVTVYNSASMYDYSTASVSGLKNSSTATTRLEGLQEGKRDYNRDLAKQIGVADLNNMWRGIFFGSGGSGDSLAAQLEKIDLTGAVPVSDETHNGELKEERKPLFTNGVLNDKAWTTYSANSSEYQSGFISLTDLRVNGLQEVKAYFIKQDGSYQLNFPDTVTLTVQSCGKDYTFSNPVLTTATAGEMQICIATFSDLGWMDDVTALTVNAAVSDETLSGNNHWIAVSEIEAYGDPLQAQLWESSLPTFNSNDANITHDGNQIDFSRLTDGDLYTEAWNTWHDDANSSKRCSGSLTINNLDMDCLQEVKAYFLPKDFNGHNTNFPDSVTLTVTRNGTDYRFDGVLSRDTSGTSEICVATFSDLGVMGDVTALKIEVQGASNGKWMALSEIEAKCYVARQTVESVGVKTVASSGSDTNSAALFDGDRVTNAYTITGSSGNVGWLDIELQASHVISEVNVYLIGTEPTDTTVKLLDAFHGETAWHYRNPDQITQITSGGQPIWRATLRWYYVDTLLEHFTAQRFGLRFTNDVQIAEIEIVTRDNHFSTRENQWPGEENSALGSTATQGLANPSLNNGEISFTVPEAGLFTQDEGNKEVYNNIQVPYVYDASTGYYTFDTSISAYDGTADFLEKDGHDVHFADTNGNGKIDKDECYDGAVLVMDEARYYPAEGVHNKPGFFPFNVGSDTPATVAQDTNGRPHYPFYTETEKPTDYHFGMQTEIEFYMTPDGTVNGANGAPITFNFSGDDDVWVYIDGKLVLDIGGIHGAMRGKIDFAANLAMVQSTPDQKVFTEGGEEGILGVTRNDFAAQEKAHVMKVYYLERGTNESNCQISYNMPRARSVMGETIVIDYGLPVKIDIMANDFTSNGQHSFSLASLSKPKYGNVRVLNADGALVEDYTQTAGRYYLEYTPTTYLSDIETITYTYYDPTDTEYASPLSAAVTIVPATSMYYEENFKNADGTDYITTTNGMTGYAGYTVEGSTADYAEYQEPGVVGTVNDSTYGTDTAYLTGSGDSHGTSYHFDTSSAGGAFQYTFTGTGTAIFARTSPTSAYIRINIKDSDGNNYFNFTNPVNGGTVPYVYIDTKYNVEGATLYNIPVYNIEGMPYGTYTVTVSIAQPSQWYTGQKDFYLDGIRVYEPMGDNATALNAYTADNEANPSVVTLRDAILTENVQKTEIAIPLDTISTSHKDQEQFFKDSNDNNRLSDGDLQTKAWTTWTNDKTHAHWTYGSITISPTDAISDLYSVEAYFTTKEGNNDCSIPQTAKLYCYTEGGARPVVFGSISFVSETNGVKLYKVTFLPLTTDKITKLIIDISHNDGTGRYMCLTELRFYSADWSNQGRGFVVFTDTADSGATSGAAVRTVKEYESFGPKQEVYLNEPVSSDSSEQTIGFVLGDWSAAKNNGAKLYLGMKTPNGSNATVTINSTEFNLKNTVDCYYDITDAVNADGVVVITASGFVSLTNLKGIGYEVKLDSGSTTARLLLAAMHVNEETPADPITDGSLGFKQASLTLSSDISVNFYVSDSTLEGWEAPYVVFSKAIYDTNGSITGDQEETVSTFTLKTSGDEACHVFTFSGINAAEMGSEITATLYASKNGVVYEGQTVPYSVLQYANNMLAKSDDAELHTLLVDLLNYGAEAQSYFGYNTANPVNAGLTDEQKACATQTVPELTTCKGITKNDGATVGFKAVSLLLEEKVTLNYYLDLSAYDGTAEELYLRVTYPDADGTAQECVIDGSEFVRRVDANGKESLLVNFSGLNATQMRTMCAAEVFSKTTGERVSDTATYSVESYAYSKAGSSDGALNMLLEMMMKYGDSASRFFTK